MRDSAELLSQEQEERLHSEAEKLASSSYWVHDIVFMKRSAERKTLPNYQEDAVVEFTNTGRSKRKTRKD